ncbi:MAG TPA: plasmid partitioning/stability family protein [Arsenophonus sp.]
MSNSRKKITAYLHPSIYQQDKKAIDFIEKMPNQLRGDFYRQAIITAAALSEIDSRLLGLISTFYSKGFDINNLYSILEQTTGREKISQSVEIKNEVINELSSEKNVSAKLSNLKK